MPPRPTVRLRAVTSYARVRAGALVSRAAERDPGPRSFTATRPRRFGETNPRCRNATTPNARHVSVAGALRRVALAARQQRRDPARGFALLADGEHCDHDRHADERAGDAPEEAPEEHREQ